MIPGRKAFTGARDGPARVTFRLNNLLLAHGAVMLIALLCAVVVGHDLFRTWEDRSHQLQSTRRQAANLAWAADQQAQAALLLADTVLADLVERVEIDGTGPGQRERLRHMLAERQASGRILLSLTVIDATGALVVDGGPVARQMHYSDRPYFQYHMTHADHLLHFSGVLRSRLTNEWVVAVSRRVDRADGGFGGVVTAAIEVAYFQNFYAAFDLGHDGVAGLFLDDWTFLVRQPFLESAVGVSLKNVAVYRDIPPDASSGMFELVSPVDGILRLYQWRRVTKYPLFIGVAFGLDERLAVWRKSAAEHLFAAVVIAVLLGFIGGRLVMQIRRLMGAERATATATEEARAAAAQYRLIADNASDMVVKANLRFIRHYVSPGCRDLLGYEPEELIGASPIDLPHPEDAALVAQSMRAMVLGRDRDLLTYRARHRDGHWIWVEASARLIRDPATGEPMEICAAVRDITPRLAAETALRVTERELERSNADLLRMKALTIASEYARGLLEASLDPLVAISPEGKITDVNEATIAVTGMARTRLIGTDFSDYFTEPVQAREAYRRAFAGGSVRDYPLTIRHRNETLTEVLYNASVYNDADGDILGVFAAARDVSARVRAEVEIAEQRARDHERMEDLERFQRLTAGREQRLIDLQNEVESLKAAAGIG
jgi:PAS domain S-box-containing protein